MSDTPSFSIGEAFKAGWNFFKENFAYFIVYELILLALMGIFSWGNGLLWVTWHILGWIIIILVKMGYYSSCLLVVNGVKPGFEQLYINWRLFISWVIASFLFALMVGIGLVLFIVPGCYLMARYGFFPFFIIDKDMGPLEALEHAGIASRGNRGHIFLLFLACIGLNILGVLIVGIGLLITAPVTLLALTVVYKKLTSEAVPIVSVENR